MGHIFYLMGKSSSGKDTIFKDLLEKLPRLKPIVLYTTRPIREGEQDGREYYFTDEISIKKLSAQGKIIELRAYETVHGVWEYATVDDGQVQLGNWDNLAIGTLESYEKLCAFYGENNVVPLYIEVEDGERLSRALEREKRQDCPKYAEMCRRFLADCEDFSEEKLKKLRIQRRFQNQKKTACEEELISYIQKVMLY